MSVPELMTKLGAAVDRSRLVETARRLVAVPSPTGDAGAVADCLAEMLAQEGFAVERLAGGHPAAPAVVVKLESSRPGRTLQFDGHLDTVHLPFVPPRVAEGMLTGSGTSDMKSGVAAAVEALRVVRETGVLAGGSTLFVAHDLHEAPWGAGQQLNDLISAGVHGDAVLIPEPMCNVLPTAGRGAATWKVTLRRAGAPVHEVMRPSGEPSVIAAGAQFVSALTALSGKLKLKRHAVAGPESVFVGQIHSGEIYNQYPQECWLEGTRRWLPDSDDRIIEREFRALVAETAAASGTSALVEWRYVRGAFALDVDDPLVTSFQTGYCAQRGSPLVHGAKAFVDDGNSFWSIARVPAITHGPLAGGQHTLEEWVSIDDLVPAWRMYALVAALYCPGVAA